MSLGPFLGIPEMTALQSIGVYLWYFTLWKLACICCYYVRDSLASRCKAITHGTATAKAASMFTTASATCVWFRVQGLRLPYMVGCQVSGSLLGRYTLDPEPFTMKSWCYPKKTTMILTTFHLAGSTTWSSGFRVKEVHV